MKAMIKFILLTVAVIIAMFIKIAFVFRLRVLNDSVSDEKEIHSKSDNYLNRIYFRINSNDMSYDIQTRNYEEPEREAENETSHGVQEIQEFKMDDVVRCLDLLSVQRNRRPMHIAFIGDSLIRQHFYSFLRKIPHYDRKTANNSSPFAEYAYHEDMNVTSHLLDNLLVSFYWRHLIRSDLIADFKRWASSSDDTQAPDFILIGITAHHLFVKNNSVNLEKYEKLVEDELMPLMQQSLAVHPHQQIIWLQQSPTLEYQISHADIYPDKIKKYNAILIRIFKGTQVLMWDAMNGIVEEYNRACTLTSFHRLDGLDGLEYEQCNDFIHPGMNSITLGTHLFINHICESAISDAMQR